MPDRVELVRELEVFREGQVRGLYRVGEEYFVVSTVPEGEVLRGWDDLLGALGTLIGPGSPVAEYATARDASLEETMAFRADAEGQQRSSRHVVAAQGEGSRSRVLEMLSAGQRWDETT